MEEMLELIRQLEACGYTCEAGPLENNIAFIQLKAMADDEPILVDGDEMENHIIDRLAEQGYVVDREMLGLIAEAEFEYLEEVGVIHDADR